jgi:pyruvate/2-oxoglutarate dehydrogenase complex dihydrolipoamide acyltransferase (E2) component
MYRSISTTLPPYAQITVDVPSMGDSITEGTIVEWCIPPGSRVREGDVLCLVETDKVTVDIKADRDGVLVRQLGEVEGVVEVGTGLYILDTDASTATIPDVAMVDASLDAADEPPAVMMAATNKTTLSRKKSIQFLGKEGWKARRLGSSSAAPAAPSATSTMIPTSGKKNGPTSITVIPYSPMLGRPTITDEEMMALMLGGADEAPMVIKGKGVGEVTFIGGKVVTAGPRGIWAV